MRHRGLHAEGNTVETTVGKLLHIVGIHRIGIRLGGDLRIVRDAPCIAHRIQHGHQIARFERGRSAATEEDGGRIRFRYAVFRLPIADDCHFTSPCSRNGRGHRPYPEPYRC